MSRYIICRAAAIPGGCGISTKPCVPPITVFETPYVSVSDDQNKERLENCAEMAVLLLVLTVAWTLREGILNSY